MDGNWIQDEMEAADQDARDTMGVVENDKVIQASTVKRMPITEFRAQGFIMEINRRFLHPYGLALEVVIDDKTGEERLGGVWDYRDDPEGIAYAEGNLDLEDFLRAFQLMETWRQRQPAREAALGFMIQPFPEKPKV